MDMVDMWMMLVDIDMRDNGRIICQTEEAKLNIMFKSNIMVNSWITKSMEEESSCKKAASLRVILSMINFMVKHWWN